MYLEQIFTVLHLQNKNIIITGASGGIGYSIVKKLTEAGANIVASGTKIEKLEELKKKFENIKILKLLILPRQTKYLQNFQEIRSNI